MLWFSWVCRHENREPIVLSPVWGQGRDHSCFWAHLFNCPWILQESILRSLFLSHQSIRKICWPYFHNILEETATGSLCSRENCVAFCSNPFKTDIKSLYFSAQHPPTASECTQWDKGFVAPGIHIFHVEFPPLLSVSLTRLANVYAPSGKRFVLFLFVYVFTSAVTISA